MSRIKNMLESELNCFEYNTDIEAIKRSGAHLRKRRKKVLLSSGEQGDLVVHR